MLSNQILLATECNGKSTPPDDDGSQFKTTTAMVENTMDSIDDPKGADVRELLDIVHTPGQLGERKVCRFIFERINKFIIALRPILGYFVKLSYRCQPVHIY